MRLLDNTQWHMPPLSIPPLKRRQLRSQTIVCLPNWLHQWRCISCSEAKISVISYWNTRLEPGLSTLCLRGTKATLSFHKIILPREFTWISVLVIAPLNFRFLIGKVGTTVSCWLGCWGHKERLCEVSCDTGLGTRGPCPMDADYSCPGCLDGPALPPHLPSPWEGL